VQQPLTLFAYTWKKKAFMALFDFLESMGIKCDSEDVLRAACKCGSEVVMFLDSKHSILSKNYPGHHVYSLFERCDCEVLINRPELMQTSPHTGLFKYHWSLDLKHYSGTNDTMAKFVGFMKLHGLFPNTLNLRDANLWLRWIQNTFKYF
jgi:hypothetical protein